ncbi:acyl CoA:acetate/3-ketoacid CoA transferase [Vibrio natriegens]|uniref:Acetate CoA-transferase YdiF n=1 Tax=Vibrio natriegens NBRC 15636 = ATCC 14048 = DSM 759 TaxID=1219067 RepID=A0AAN0Y6R8_VIBNA|nr:CoA-transferase [Vibrio natriegens]ALR18223.1 3-oxoacid CoA-transferase [Vibrio natriegens NBRC 15636 = ATCC 14048 = DSM 759]ANQ14170.1 3-oxoacid CoA-transferase [Vibrio natriegens NBRC 15636 = ATCC 14048 = DSM 759]EPM40206.1 CoA transferase [Vibrio natriegens NBRC 15636 = ATCC 14048 = DSM 759]MDX6028891.1 CoA-transferase [Vibrio natriegens NBRC 15636 = ATCC 14048 = DSM 759]UUI14394.1 3-oxoacid CoA-transferase [Vibrio natriegens]
MVTKLTAEQAAEWIEDGDAVLLGGFIGSVVPEAIERAIGERFRDTQSPRDLTLLFAAGQGDGQGRAINHLAEQGLVKCAIGGHWGLVPKLQQLAVDNLIQGYNLPQGIISHLLRDTAAGKLGTVSKVGLGTFVDPRLEGGKINQATSDDWVELIELGGEEHLFYHKLPVTVSILRGTTADENGNITMEDECLIVESLAAAQAARNNGGKVIVQVKQIVPAGKLDPHAVKIPGIFVDAVVVCEDPTEHMQTFATMMNPEFVGIENSDDDLTTSSSPSTQSKLDAKTIIARRAAMELKPNSILNLGIGAPEYIAEVAKQAGILDQFTLTVEPGAVGGIPQSGLDFGASRLPQAIIGQDQMFDFYDGGGVDQAFLGLAQSDVTGNINVSRFGSKIAGCGGFINITQNAKQVYFCGTFTAQGLAVEVDNQAVNIVQEGKQKKFIKQVEQITFSAAQALSNNKPVMYITERAVFELSPSGLALIEIAPGVDLEKDILQQMEFTPVISPSLKVMPNAIFQPSFELTL